MGAGAAIMALAGVSCTTEPAPQPEPASVVAVRIVELGGSAEAFSGIALGREALTARAVADGTLQYWDLTDGVRPVSGSSTPYAAVPFDQVDADKIQEMVTQLAAQCDQDEYRVSVDVLTPSAMLTELRCGDDTFEGLITHAPVSVLLDGAPLPDSSGTSVEETWQVALDLLETLDPSLAVGSVSIAPDTMSLQLSDAAATAGCRPALVLERDGTDITSACRRTQQEPPISLASFTATDLAQLQLGAMDQAGIVGPDSVRVSISSNQHLEPQLEVRRGSAEASIPLAHR